MRKISIFYLYIVVFLYSLAANFAHPVTPTFIKELGLHDYMFGLAFACMSFSNFLFSPLWGKLCNKYGSAKILGLAHIGYGLMQLIFGLSTKEWHICAARLGGGFFISAVTVSQFVYILDNSESSGHDMAVASTINIVIAQFGFLIGGLIGENGTKFTFMVQAVSLAAIGVLVLIFLKDKDREEYKFSIKDANPFSVFFNCSDIMNKAIVLFLTIATLSLFAVTCYEQCFNYYLTDVYKFTSSNNGIIKAVIGTVSFIINSLVTMRLIKNTNTINSIIYVLAVVIMMTLGICVIDDYKIFMVINVVFFGLESALTPMLQDILSKYKTKKQAEFVGLFSAVKMLGSVFGSLLAGLVYDRGAKLPFVCSLIIFVVCLLLSLCHKKERKALYE